MLERSGASEDRSELTSRLAEHACTCSNFGMTTALATDLGGSGLKAGLVSASAQLIATERVDRPIPPGPEDRSEVDPEVWWDDLGHATMRLAAAPPVAYASVAAIAIWGMTRTQVVVDEAGTALRQPTAGLNANQLAHLVMTGRDDTSAGVVER